MCFTQTEMLLNILNLKEFLNLPTTTTTMIVIKIIQFVACMFLETFFNLKELSSKAF